MTAGQNPMHELVWSAVAGMGDLPAELSPRLQAFFTDLWTWTQTLASYLWSLPDEPTRMLLQSIGLPTEFPGLVQWLLAGIVVMTIYRGSWLGPLRGENGEWYWMWLIILWPVLLIVIGAHRVRHVPQKPQVEKVPEPVPEPVSPDHYRQIGGA